MKIVLVHGRSQQLRDPDELRYAWTEALRIGFSQAGLPWPIDVEFVLPFYGDRLDRLVEEISSPILGQLLARGDLAEGANDCHSELLTEIVNNYPGLSEQPVTVQAADKPIERGFRNSTGALAILRALDRTPLGSTAIDRLARDVSLYLTTYGVRKEVDSIVATATDGGACIVIAHSLGTVVAYNVLAKRSAIGPIPLLITLGSPLSIGAIRARVERPLHIPACVDRWFNVRDPRDAISLFPLESPRFTTSPPIENCNIDNHTGNRHGIEGYLSNPAIARRVSLALSGVSSDTKPV